MRLVIKGIVWLFWKLSVKIVITQSGNKNAGKDYPPTVTDICIYYVYVLRLGSIDLVHADISLNYTAVIGISRAGCKMAGHGGRVCGVFSYFLRLLLQNVSQF